MSMDLACLESFLKLLRLEEPPISRLSMVSSAGSSGVLDGRITGCMVASPLRLLAVLRGGIGMGCVESSHDELRLGFRTTGRSGRSG